MMVSPFHFHWQGLLQTMKNDSWEEDQDILTPELPPQGSGSLASSASGSLSSVGSDSTSPLLPVRTLSFVDFHRARQLGAGEKVRTDQLTATVSQESLLGELLGDIRRAPSLASSTPNTVVSLSEGEGENVFDCKLRRSKAELKSLDLSELKRIAETLKKEVDCESSLLVRLLHVKDKRTWRANKQADRLSAILKDYARQNDLCTALSFSLYPPLSSCNHQSWLNAWKVLSRLPRGIPKTWRKALWGGLTSVSLTSSSGDWPSILLRVFSEHPMPGDESLGMQIVKDLHRTGDTGFSTEEEHAILKRVLLAYARYNQSTGYCQGFNILAALILKVVEFDEHMALQVMVHMIDHVLPENYFAQNLYALSVDMATFRELLKHILPELSQHIDGLQREASGTVKKAYSSECPPDIQSIHAYEPPLADVFSMQWFLTIFASALPRKATRRVWDLILLEGSEVLLYTGVAVMAVMEKDLLQTSTAADFYSTMALLGERLRKAQLLPSAEFIQIIHTIQECVTVPNATIPPIKTLREKYAYNVCPCADPETDDLADMQSRNNARPCPKPSRGGAFGKGGVSKSADSSNLFREKARLKEAEFINGQRNPSLPEGEKGGAMKAQVKLLQEHYKTTARQPAMVKCNIDLAPPQARITCPQTKYSFAEGHALTRPLLQSSAYGPDVPDEVVEKSKLLSGQGTYDMLGLQRRKVFTIDYTFPGEAAKYGLEVGLEPAKWGDFRGTAGILSNSTAGLRGEGYMTAREHIWSASGCPS